MNANQSRWITCGIASLFTGVLACILIPAVGVLIVAIQRGLLDTIPWGKINPLNIVLFLLLIIITIFSVLFLALVLLSLYPIITLTPQGFEYRTVFSRGVIHPDEVLLFSSPKLIKSIRVLVIQRNGATLLSPKGLLIQVIHGILLGFNKPVFILWGDARELEMQFKKSQ
jgi:hypothetical protein